LKKNRKLAYAISAALSAAAAHAAYGAVAPDNDSAASSSAEGVTEVVVTAQRRSESIQDVPVTVQAMTGDQLKQLNVTTFDDLLKYTPNVTYSGSGPGTGNIFVRGLAYGSAGNQSSATIAPFPNVATYLDDQSMQFPGRNNDVYLVDMERVEVLEGPQGTLFGGGAEAGAIRYITNKPKLDVTEGDVNAGYGITAGGDPNTSLNATINLPLIPDTLAVRAVIFDDHRGGYISNVPGTMSVGGGPVANNASLVASNTNTVDYTGARLSLLYKISDDWDLLLQQNYQNMEADGYFDAYPNAPSGASLQPYQIVAFTPAYDKDRYESTAWTLNGKIGDLKAVYTGSYMVRHIEQQQDYSNYLRSAGGSYYTCTGSGAAYFKSAKPTTCYAPTGDWNDSTQNYHQSHEIRLSTDESYPLRGLFGAYWEKFVIDDQMNFNYLPVPQCDAANLATALGGGPDCLSAVGPLPGSFASDPGLRENSNTAFGEDAQRGYKQTALFVSADYDIIPKVLTITGGTRYFHYDEFETGSEFYSETSNPLILNHPNGACTAAGGCGFGMNLNKTESGFRSRGNLTWHIAPDLMAYYTFSQGFRPGGFNRTETTPNGTPVLAGEAPYIAGDNATRQYDKPAGYSSDSLTNNEIGFKSELLDHRLMLDVSAYIMRWNNVQLALFDPVSLGNSSFDINGPSYTIKGVEFQFAARVTDGLTVQGSSSTNSSKQDNAPCLTSNVVSAGNPTPIGQCITQVKGLPYTNPYGVVGSSLPFSPAWQFNLRARYDWAFNTYRPFVWVGANHTGASRNEPPSYPSGDSPSENPPTTTLLLYSMPSYTTYDAALGVLKDSWTVQLTGSNLTNSDVSTFTTSGNFIEAESPLRPRVLTLQFGYKF
jgi:iron complex outermembrane recepter protein